MTSFFFRYSEAILIWKNVIYTPKLAQNTIYEVFLAYYHILSYYIDRGGTKRLQNATGTLRERYKIFG